MLNSRREPSVAPLLAIGDLLLLEVQSWQGFLAVTQVTRTANRQIVSGRAYWFRVWQSLDDVSGIVRDESAGDASSVGVGTLQHDDSGYPDHLADRDVVEWCLRDRVVQPAGPGR